VDYINSTGIALIVGLLGKARAAEVPVAASGLSDHYREIFEITRLSDFITIEAGAPTDAPEGST
jgi:anti-anti-sigma factor